MPIHETRPVSVTADATTIAPTFVPLTDVGAGTIIIPNQCQLTFTGTPSPLEVTLMLCAPGTPLGDPGEAVILSGDVFNVTADVVTVLEGNLPALPMAGVFGFSVPVQPVPQGAKVAGVISLVR